MESSGKLGGGGESHPTKSKARVDSNERGYEGRERKEKVRKEKGRTKA